MERYEDFVYEDLHDKWVVSAFNTDIEEVETLDIPYWPMIRFIADHYDFSRTEAISHLLRCGEEETEKLLKEYFLKKHSNE